VQWRRNLRASRVADIPNDPDDIAWNDEEQVRIPIAPLWWRKEAVFEVRVRAVHDDNRLVFQLQWDDPTRDDRSASGAPQGDGVAVQITEEAEPPMFAMGGSEGVEIWHWKAFRSEEVAGALDLLSRIGHDEVDMPRVIPGVTQPMRTGEALRVHGPIGMTTGRGQGRAIVATPRWRDGVWTLVISRGLRARKTDELAIAPRQRLFVAFAVWNGSIDLHAASKSVSTWHALELAR
jgi:DMSO reductase family type II enzyme heme b subunit